jgi:hypothetical protein
VPAENLLSPDTVRRVMWEPAGSDVESVAAQLRQLHAREWQIGLAAPMLADAISSAATSASSADEPADRSGDASADPSGDQPDG